MKRTDILKYDQIDSINKKDLLIDLIKLIKKF
jgi:hypothetical protein